MLAVPGVGNVHVGRWGEGSEHCHIWFLARPAPMEQLRSSFAAIWDDVLPPVPEDDWRANLAIVRRELEYRLTTGGDIEITFAVRCFGSDSARGTRVPASFREGVPQR